MQRGQGTPQEASVCLHCLVTGWEEGSISHQSDTDMALQHTGTDRQTDRQRQRQTEREREQRGDREILEKQRCV